MAARTQSRTTGGANFTIAFKIVSGAVSTTTTDYFIFDQQKKSTLGALIDKKAGKTIVLDQNKNNPLLTAFLAGVVKPASDAPTTEYYEDGTSYVVGSSDLASIFAITVGATIDGKRQLFAYCADISAGDMDLEKGTVTSRALTFTTVEWNGAAALTIPNTVWDLITKLDGSTKLIDKADVTLPTTFAVGTACDEFWATALA